MRNPEHHALSSYQQRCQEIAVLKARIAELEAQIAQLMEAQMSAKDAE